MRRWLIALGLAAATGAVAAPAAPTPPTTLGWADWVGDWSGKLKWSSCSAEGEPTAALALDATDGAVTIDLKPAGGALGTMSLVEDGGGWTGQQGDVTVRLRRSKAELEVAIQLDSGCEVRGTLARATTGIANCDRLAAWARIESQCTKLTRPPLENPARLARQRATWTKSSGEARAKVAEQCAARSTKVEASSSRPAARRTPIRRSACEVRSVRHSAAPVLGWRGAAMCPSICARPLRAMWSFSSPRPRAPTKPRSRSSTRNAGAPARSWSRWPSKRVAHPRVSRHNSASTRRSVMAQSERMSQPDRLDRCLSTMSPNEPNLALRAAPGTVPPWVRAVVAAAAVVTIAMVGLGGQLLYGHLDHAHSTGQWWLRTGLAVAVAAWVALSFLPPSRNSRFIRLAVLLPVAHAGAIAIGWSLWSRVATHVTLDARSPLADGLPLAKLTLIACLVFVAVALFSSRRRSGEWVHGFAVLALSELLLVGLWMPVVATMWGDQSASMFIMQPPFVDELGRIVAYVVGPPTLAAVAYTVLVIRRSRWLAERSRLAFNTVATLLGLACLARLTADADAMILYAHFVPVLLVAALVAIIAVALLAVVLAARAVLARRRFRDHAHVRGVVDAEGTELVVGIEITSWLRGPRIVQRPFAVGTAHGSVPVSGANLVAAMPAASTQLAVGEALAILRTGDTIEIACQAPSKATLAGDPFRTLAGPEADSIWVAPARAEQRGFASLALALWRPCVAYLLIVTAIALPALAALLG